MTLSTYSAGEKLTAASLNLIVSDVNDNTADIATNTADLNAIGNVTALALTGAFNIPTGAATNITFGAGTETVDVSGWHSTSTNTERITPNVEGYYYASAWVKWNETSLNSYGVQVRKNATTEAEFWAYGDFYPAGGVSKVIYLNGTTDYISMSGQSTSGVTRQIYRAGLSVMLVRKA